MLKWWMKVAVLMAASTMVVACGDEEASAPSSDLSDPEPEMVLPDPQPEAEPKPLQMPGNCVYTNPFSQGEECKEYTGASWTLETAVADCEQVFAGAAGLFTAGESCKFESELGRCEVGDPGSEGFAFVSAGDDAGSCAVAQVGCETFAMGTFTPGGVCNGEEPPDVITGDVFIPPYEDCRDPLDGEPAGNGPDGQVCTQVGIGGATEEGRAYEDYASCDVVISQRPYFGFLIEPDTAEDDPRLSDETYMNELAWVTDQVEAAACVCCHSEDASPNGQASSWDIRKGPIWTDSISDDGIAMLAGLVDSRSFGAFPPEQNNGFDRETTGLPTNDIARMQAFLTSEYVRRGNAVEDAETIRPFGGPIYDQLIYEPSGCTEGEGIDADGNLQWGNSPARYVYVLEVGADNPGVPPNMDLPEGTVWRLDVDPFEAPLQSGIGYGDVRDGVYQAFPEEGTPASLVPGTDYYMYVLFDIGVPVTRCLFTYEG